MQDNAVAEPKLPAKQAETKPAVRPKPTPVVPISGTTVTTSEIAPRFKTRHYVLGALFVIVGLMPALVASFYLFTRGADQYHSTAAFSIRSEDFGSPFDVLDAFTQMGSSSAGDSVILHEFVRSQPLIERVDANVDLRTLYRREPRDFVFSLPLDASIEDLLSYWERMVHIQSVEGGGVLSIQVRAFAPEDAQRIAQAIVDESAALVNHLSQIAQEDAMRFSLQDLEDATERLRSIRVRVREFRSDNQLINPEADVESQMGVVSHLQAELADALVRRARIVDYTDGADPRLNDLDTTIRVLREQIERERQSIARGSSSERSLSDVVGDYEELLLELEFAEQAYTAALAAAEQARFEARRQSRYVAVHIPPTLPQESVYPQRGLMVALILLCSITAWCVAALIYYNIRDRSGP